MAQQASKDAEYFPARSFRILSGLLAARPAFGVADRYYWATDVQVLFRDTGAAWEIVSAGIQYLHWIPDMLSDINSHLATLAITVNRVYLVPVQVLCTVTVDDIFWLTESLVSGANTVRVGLYRDNGLTPQGGAKLIDLLTSGGVTMRRVFAGGFAATRLTPGLYWLAWVANAANNLYMSYFVIITGAVDVQPYYYDFVWGALTDPCPAVTATIQGPIMGLLVDSIP